MLDTEWPEKGCALAEARERTADPADLKDWRASINRLKNLGPRPSYIGGDRIADVHQFDEYKNRLDAESWVCEDKINHKFRRLLETGKLFAYGRKANLAAQPELIAADIWSALTHIDWCASSTAEGRSDGMVFLAVHIYAKLKTSIVEEPKNERECRLWLEEAMRRNPDRRPTKKGVVFQDAKKKWPGLYRRTFDRIWDKAIADTGALAWKHPGAPKKSLQ